MRSSLKFATIILAAGEGKRMKSRLPKVLHPLGHAPIIVHTVELIKKTAPSQIIVVASPTSLNQLKKHLKGNIDFAVQRKPLGTADATLAGFKKVKAGIKTVLIVYGADMAFFKPDFIKALLNAHISSNSIGTIVTIKLENPTGLGRIIRKNEQIVDIVEEKDATSVQKKVKEVNAGIYVFERKLLTKNLDKVKESRATGEKYLVDLIKIAANNRQKIENFQLTDLDQWLPIDSQDDLKLAQNKLIRRIHIMGIAGAGASAAGQIAKAAGFEVSGCDLVSNSAYTKNFSIKIQKSHSGNHLANVGALIVSPAVLKFDPNNPEISQARKKGIPTLTWQEFQGRFLQESKFTLAVAGAYGKSTTAAMIAKILTDCNFDPTCEVGAILLNWGTNFRIGKSSYYVCEADEYNDNFLNYKPDIAVVLNMGWDHPDYFKNKKSVISSYKKFISGIKKGGVLITAKSPDLEKLEKFARKDIKIIKIKDFSPIKLSIIGDFRKDNANAALTVAQILGISPGLAKKSLSKFKGLARRLEYKGKVKGTRIFDDYAVQPFTVKTTANALSDRFKNQKMALVFEPHTFSRIKIFFNDFAIILKEIRASRIFITEVYPAREQGDVRKLPKIFAQKVGSKAKFSGSVEQTAIYLKGHLSDFDIICTMGAGNVYKIYNLLKT